jgi:hypothetical protein
MAYNASSLVTLGLLKTVTARVQEEYTKAINEAIGEDAETASDEEVQEMLTEVFGKNDEDLGSK